MNTKKPDFVAMSSSINRLATEIDLLATQTDISMNRLQTLLRAIREESEYGLSLVKSAQEELL